MKQSPRRRKTDTALSTEVIAEIQVPTLKIIQPQGIDSKMGVKGEYPLLASIAYPTDVRKLRKGQLRALAKELREFLTQSVSISGGHFSAGLG
ncbi:1-deoxy-D-xylulose-5-phosphate synthase N-terminal domain-containing protein, partial [Methyloglobulus sp.]|uniref:1-deoxy-D-xylulose-5-phosphate synthase N-terminal domain-containing protein n=1 Tax=Methyloglobulus sp. TaxID=2518622 RepID=UPI003988B343